MGKEWTPERKAEASRKAKARWAERQGGATFTGNTAENAPLNYGIEVPKSRPQSGDPVILADWRAYPNPWYGQRSVKMLRPICRICQDRENVAPGWWFECEHDPYVTLSERTESIPVYEDLADGRRRVVRMDTVVSYVPQPNRVEPALTMKVNGGRGVAMGQGRGFIFPSELRSPHFPNGIADACQYRECWKQTGLKEYGNEDGVVGVFCRDIEADLIWKAENPDSGALEIGFDSSSLRRRRTQLAAVPV